MTRIKAAICKMAGRKISKQNQKCMDPKEYEKTTNDDSKK